MPGYEHLGPPAVPWGTQGCCAIAGGKHWGPSSGNTPCPALVSPILLIGRAQWGGHPGAFGSLKRRHGAAAGEPQGSRILGSLHPQAPTCHSPRTPGSLSLCACV